MIIDGDKSVSSFVYKHSLKTVKFKICRKKNSLNILECHIFKNISLENKINDRKEHFFSAYYVLQKEIGQRMCTF